MLEILERLKKDITSKHNQMNYSVENTTSTDLRTFYSYGIIGLGAQRALLEDLIELVKNNT